MLGVFNVAEDPTEPQQSKVNNVVVSATTFVVLRVYVATLVGFPETIATIRTIY